MTTWHTPWGTLSALADRHHPVRYPVDSLETLNTYHRMWEDAQYVSEDESATLAQLDELVGEDGVVTRFWGPTAIPRLLESDIGMETFYYLWADHPREMEALLETMHEKQLTAFEQLAGGPWESVLLAENTSTFYISPRIYARHNMPHQREFCEIVKQAGKTALLHMCGHVQDLLPLIKETGCDGIHTLTPPPTGNTPWEQALDVIGEDLIIMGCLDPTIWISGPLASIGPALDALITPRLREANFVLAPMADGIPVPLERFEAIHEWMERQTW
jgi:uroporphyrinogen-III decarboxylase